MSVVRGLVDASELFFSRSNLVSKSGEPFGRFYAVTKAGSAREPSIAPRVPVTMLSTVAYKRESWSRLQFPSEFKKNDSAWHDGCSLKHDLGLPLTVYISTNEETRCIGWKYSKNCTLIGWRMNSERLFVRPGFKFQTFSRTRRFCEVDLTLSLIRKCTQ